MSSRNVKNNRDGVKLRGSGKNRKDSDKRTEFEPVIETIKRYNKFILTAHETPDGDALGSEYALSRVLKQMGKEALIFNADPAAEKFLFVDNKHEFTVLKDDQQLPTDIAEFILVILDVSDLNNIGQVAKMVLPRVQKYFIIDHHESDEDILSGNLIQKSASSTSEILYLLFREMGVEIDFPIAQSLFMGIIFDTGCFIYPKTTAVTFEIAHDLVSKGVNPNQIYSQVYESNSVPSLLLASKVTSTLELYYDNHVAVQTMTGQMIQESGAKYEEADQIINVPLKSKDVRVSIFFKENLEGVLRCSMRSKGNINVAAIAQGYGGGGHLTAAGFKCKKPFDMIKVELLEMMKVHFIQETSCVRENISSSD